MSEPFWVTLEKAGFSQDAVRLKAELLAKEIEKRSTAKVD